MNKRIRELIDQATIRGVEYLAGNDGHPTPTIYFDKEKFAQLIIRECCNIVNNLEGVHNPGDCSTVEYIKEHFGVDV